MKKSIFINENNFEKARKAINEAKKNNLKIVFSSEVDDINRKVMEKLPIDMVLLNQSFRKDFQKQRNSGFNQVLAKIAKKNNIAIGINFDEIIKAKGKEKSDILSRVRQNIELCKKNKLDMEFIHKSAKRNKTNELKSLGLVLKMPTQMTKTL